MLLSNLKPKTNQNNTEETRNNCECKCNCTSEPVDPSCPNNNSINLTTLLFFALIFLLLFYND